MTQAPKAMDALLSPDQKFACLGLPRVFHDLDAVTEIRDGLFATTEPPFALNGYVKEWMGSVYADRFAKCDLFLLARHTSESPEVLDDENRELARTCGRLLLGMLLQGSMHVARAGISVKGSHESGGIHVREMGNLRPYRHYKGTRRLVVTLDTLTAASAAAAGILTLEDSPDHARLRRGFRAFQSALESAEHEDRLHQSVRAIEAVVKPQQGKTTRQFKSRVSALVRAKHDTLGEMYELRSAVEHLNDPEGAVPGLFEPDDAPAKTRVYQAHETARWLYRRILEDPRLLRHFRTDADIGAFQALTLKDKRSLLGTPPNIEALKLEAR